MANDLSGPGSSAQFVEFSARIAAKREEEKERSEEADKLLAEIAEFPMSLVRFEENSFFISKTRHVSGGAMAVVADFSEDDLTRLRVIVSDMKARRDSIRKLLPDR